MSWGVWTAIAGCAALLGAVAGIAKERAKSGSIRREAEEKAQRELLDTIHLQRHDLMNDLQVLLGYIQLNKQEKVKAHVEHMALRLQEDSAIAKLDDSRLISSLYAFRAGAHQVKLRMDIEHDLSLPAFGERGRLAAKAIAALVPCWEASSRAGQADEAALTVSVARKDGRLRIAFDYENVYEQEMLEGRLQRGLEQLRAGESGGAPVLCDASAGRLVLLI